MHHTCRFRDHQTARCGRILQGSSKAATSGKLQAASYKPNAYLLQLVACSLPLKASPPIFLLDRVLHIASF